MKTLRYWCCALIVVGVSSFSANATVTEPDTTIQYGNIGHSLIRATASGHEGLFNHYVEWMTSNNTVGTRDSMSGLLSAANTAAERGDNLGKRFATELLQLLYVLDSSKPSFDQNMRSLPMDLGTIVETAARNMRENDFETMSLIVTAIEYFGPYMDNLKRLNAITHVAQSLPMQMDPSNPFSAGEPSDPYKEQALQRLIGSFEVATGFQGAEMYGHAVGPIVEDSSIQARVTEAAKQLAAKHYSGLLQQLTGQTLLVLDEFGMPQPGTARTVIDITNALSDDSQWSSNELGIWLDLIDPGFTEYSTDAESIAERAGDVLVALSSHTSVASIAHIERFDTIWGEIVPAAKILSALDAAARALDHPVPSPSVPTIYSSSADVVAHLYMDDYKVRNAVDVDEEMNGRLRTTLLHLASNPRLDNDAAVTILLNQIVQMFYASLSNETLAIGAAASRALNNTERETVLLNYIF